MAVTTGSGVDEAAVAQLRASHRGALLRPGDDGYDAARRVWNGMIDRQPGAHRPLRRRRRRARRGRPSPATDGLLVSVRGGGHNVTGNAVCDGRADARPLADEGHPRRPRAGARRGPRRALTWGEFDHETQAFGLATTGGQVSTTGIAGLTLGGGVGWLMRKHGLDRRQPPRGRRRHRRRAAPHGERGRARGPVLGAAGRRRELRRRHRLRVPPAPGGPAGHRRDGALPGRAGDGGPALPPGGHGHGARRPDDERRLPDGAAGALRAGAAARAAHGRGRPLPRRAPGGGPADDGADPGLRAARPSTCSGRCRTPPSSA